MSIFNKLKSFVKSKTYKNTRSTPSQITVKEDIASSYVLELSPWRVGERIEGRFEIHDIKKGGMGIIYLCYDHAENMPVAIKTFQDKYLTSKEMIERFKKEAETWVRLEKHKNIVRAYYVLDISGRLYIVLEYVPGDKTYGSDLTGWIRLGGLDLATILNFAIQFCFGIEHAERKFKEMGKSFVHCDIKPGNIMVTQDKVVKITDFGLVKAFTELKKDITTDIVIDNVTGLERDKFYYNYKTRIWGTPPYMSPEQCRGEENIDIRSDIYSFGCVLYEMLTRQPPFKCPGFEYYIAHHLKVKPKPVIELVSDIPKELNNLVMKCLEKEPEKRYQDFKNLREELSEIYFKLTGEKIKEETPEELEAWELVNKGASLANLGKYQEAIICYNNALEINPNLEGAWNNKGVALENLNKYQEAIVCFDRAIVINAKFDQPWYNKGNIFYTLGKFQEAIFCLQKALEINPMHIWAWIGMGIVLENLEKFQDAIYCYEKAIKLNPKCVEAWYNAGISFHKVGEFHKALACYERAIELNSNFAEAWNRKGIILGEMGNLFDAIDCFNKALRINPNFSDAWNNKGIALARIGKYQEANHCYDNALKINPNFAEAWFNKGVDLANIGKFQEAISCYNKALNINPKFTKAWNNKGIILDMIGKPLEAIDCYDKALNIDPNYSEAWINKGIALCHLSNFNDAITCYDKALEINPIDAKAWYNRGIILAKIGKFGEAIESFENYVKYAPQKETLMIAQVNKIIRQLKVQLGY